MLTIFIFTPEIQTSQRSIWSARNISWHARFLSGSCRSSTSQVRKQRMLEHKLIKWAKVRGKLLYNEISIRELNITKNNNSKRLFYYCLILISRKNHSPPVAFAPIIFRIVLSQNKLSAAILSLFCVKNQISRSPPLANALDCNFLLPAL